MAKVLIDMTPVRIYPEFRRIWIGQGVSSIGSQLAVIALAVQIYQLTHSTIDVGLISLIQLVPSLLGSLIGGAIADAMERRRLLKITGSCAATVAALLALNASRHHPVIWAIYALAATSAFIQSIDSPGRTSILMGIIDREYFVPANVLRSATGQFAQVIGPSVGGVLLAVFHASVVYWINSASFCFALGTVFTINAHAPQGGGTRFGLKSINEGLAFLKGRQALQGAFLADLNANILGLPTSLFPALAVLEFHGGAKTMGLLYAAPGAGSALASTVSGWTQMIRRPGYAVCVCIVVWGLALAAFGVAHWLVLALALLAVAGFADQISAIFRSSIVQNEAPDRLRGRLSSIQQAVVQAGPRLGNGEAGLVAGISTPQISVISGGLGSVLGILIMAYLMPKFTSYEMRTTEEETEISEEVPPG